MQIGKRAPEILADYFKKQRDVRLAYIFGSVARGRASKISDIDIGVLLAPTLSESERFKLQLRIITDLMAMLKTKKVDVVVMNEAPLILNYEIIKANRAIFVRSESQKIDFEQRITCAYLDRMYYERRFTKEFLARVARRGLS